jgi:quercetin dioxygenase-like cupin family protein
VMTWKVTTADNGGSFFLFEDEMDQGKTTPWHCHPDSDECSYLLEGECEVNIDGDVRSVSAGGMWMVPRGVSHAFIVTSAKARILAFQSPGASEAFYLGASEPLGDARGPVDFDKIREVAASTGATVVQGPPPFARV